MIVINKTNGNKNTMRVSLIAKTSGQFLKAYEIDFNETPAKGKEINALKMLGILD
jgi:hypothetical protein